MSFQHEGSKYFGVYLERTARRVRQAYLHVFQQLGIDITTEQWVLLKNLYERDGQSQTELAAGSFKNAPTVSRIIDLLVKKGWVLRQVAPGDRRRFQVCLTPLGHSTVEAIYPAVLELRSQGWQGLSDEDYHTFIRILNCVFDNYEAMGDHSSPSQDL